MVRERSKMRRPLVLACLSFAFGIFIQFHSGAAYCIGGIAAGAAALMLGVFAAMDRNTDPGDGAPGAAEFAESAVDTGAVRNWACSAVYRAGRWLALSAAAILLLSSFGCGSLLMFFEMKREGPPTFPSDGMDTVNEKEAAAAKRKEIVLKGEAVSVEEAEDDCKITLRTAFREKILVTVTRTPESFGVSSYADLTGREVTAVGKLQAPAGRRNPGGFDYRLYLRTKNVFALLDGSHSRLTVSRRVKSPVMHRLALVKEAFTKKLQAGCGGDEELSGLLIGMLFGDKSQMDEGLYEEFQKNGTAHLLAVSGLHVNVLYLYIRKFLKGRRDLIPSLAVLLFLTVYAALSGFSASVVRASLMIAFSIAAVLLRRDYDMCTGIAAAAVLLLLLNPYRLFDLGFQLSFLAVSSLAVVLPWARQKAFRSADRLKKEWIWRLSEIICPMAVIQGVMAPVTAYAFQYFSWSSFLLNPLLIPLAGLVVPLGILLLPLSFIPGAAGELLFAAGLNGAGIPARTMIFLSRFFSERGWGFSWTASPPMGCIILFYAGIFLFCSEGCYILRRKRKTGTLAVMSAAILFFASFFPFAAGYARQPHPFSYQSYPMVFVDVGQGDCLHIRTPGGKNVLIDGGGSVNFNIGKKTLAPYLLKNGVKKIDLALVTHLHADHYRGIEELAAILPVKKIGMYESNRLREDHIRGEWRPFGIDYKREPKIQYLKKGDRIWLEKDVWVEVLAPERRTEEEYEELILDEADENASSLVMAVHYGGLRVLMTGDMGFEGENALLSQYGQTGKEGSHPAAVEGKTDAANPLFAHILKTGHHGSRYSTSELFLSAVSPDCAVIQVGKNNFGHPSARVIELFQNYDIITYRTDRQGAVLIHRIADNEAVLSDINKEKIWHISLHKRGNTPTKRFREI